VSAGPGAARPRRSARAGALLPPRPRRALTVVHVVSSVGLAGHAAAVLVIALTGHTSAEYRLMPQLVSTLGIPLLFTALLSGLLLGWLTPWGVFRHGWVAVKLGLLLAVLGCGIGVLRPAMAGLVADPGARGAWAAVVAGEVFQIVALTASAALSVFKPRGILPGTR